MSLMLTASSLSDYAQSLGFGAHELAQLEAELYRMPVANLIEMSKRAAQEAPSLSLHLPL
jgi:hypothetical protein